MIKDIPPGQRLLKLGCKPIDRHNLVELLGDTSDQQNRALTERMLAEAKAKNPGVEVRVVDEVDEYDHRANYIFIARERDFVWYISISRLVWHSSPRLAQNLQLALGPAAQSPISRLSL